MVKLVHPKIICCLLVMLLFKNSPVTAQVSISGPACIIPGLTYQYLITGSSGQNTGFQICITGGRLITGDSCTTPGNFQNAVLVLWNDTGYRKLNLASASGNAVLAVQGTTALAGGLIHMDDKARLYDSTISGYRFRCEAASGGACDPVYVYQWQQSANNVNWTNIPGAVGRDFDFTGVVRVNTYFRRVTTETNSQTIAYSDSGLLTVVFNP